MFKHKRHINIIISSWNSIFFLRLFEQIPYKTHLTLPYQNAADQDHLRNFDRGQKTLIEVKPTLTEAKPMIMCTKFDKNRKNQHSRFVFYYCGQTKVSTKQTKGNYKSSPSVLLLSERVRIPPPPSLNI